MRLYLFIKLKYDIMILCVGIKYYMRDLLSDLNYYA